MRDSAALRKSPAADSQDALVEQHSNLVRRIAFHLITRLPPSVQVDDLIQAGMIGLLEASRNYALRVRELKFFTTVARHIQRRNAKIVAGTGSATVRLQVGKRVRERDDQVAHAEAFQQAAAQAVEESLRKLRMPPPSKPQKRRAKRTRN